ncbi:MAG TPA: hypothetical protein VGW33_00900 [Terriglobia bacterium]|nr:hypothetical protein [Terriglobia bacterium]
MGKADHGSRAAAHLDGAGLDNVGGAQSAPEMSRESKKVSNSGKSRWGAGRPILQ